VPEQRMISMVASAFHRRQFITAVVAGVMALSAFVAINPAPEQTFLADAEMAAMTTQASARSFLASDQLTSAKSASLAKASASSGKTVGQKDKKAASKRVKPGARKAAVKGAAIKTRATKKGSRASKRIRPQAVRPVSSVSLSAHFGARSRLWSTYHTGQDFRAPSGTRVYSAKAGKVVFAGWDGAYGRRIAIDHGSGVETWYAHLSTTSVKPGQRVRMGQSIGRVGSTGRATGSHLHFEVRKHGKPVSPMSWLRSVGVRI
jgi:murein DD-endopeptidase MepM/ murein hydrolase activator NlpD